MTISLFHGRILLMAAMSLLVALTMGQPKQVKAAYLSLVACPATHPYQPGIELKYGETEAMARRPGKEFGGEPLRDAPPDRYASNGWLYEIDDNPFVAEYLICVYADDSKVNYPLPDHAQRGQGRCDFVSKWDYPDSFEGEFIRDWPYGLDRKPMAICTFDFYARRIIPSRKPN